MKSEDSVLQAVMASLVLAVVTGVMVTIGLDQLYLGARLRPQVERVLDLPILGALPRLAEEEARNWGVRGCDPEPKFKGVAKSGTGVLVQDSPDSLAAEKIRSLIVHLLRLDGPVRRILVASCWPGEGKSMVSANLAAGLTRFGVKVALVDGDLRRPNLSHAFETEGEPGFRQFLSGDVPIEELTRPIALDNVIFLPAGTGGANAAELLAEKGSLQGLLGEKSEDRFLIIDSPPLSVCSDALMLSDEVDGVLLVINASHWDGAAELQHIQNLEEHGVPILGVVLNGVRASELGQGYLSRYQRYYTPGASQVEKISRK